MKSLKEKNSNLFNSFLFLLALISGLIFYACSEDTPLEKDNSDNKVKASIIESNNNFSIDIFKEIVKNELVDDNIFISPLSMYYALALAGNGSNGETYDAFSDLLGWNGMDNQAVLNSMKELIDELLPQDPEVVVEIANSLWPNESFGIKEEYKTEAKEYFNAEVHPLDFTSPDALEIINDWIADNTHDKIQDMLDHISPDAVLYIINAIYFNATWKYQFEDTLNYEAPFLRHDGTNPEVTYMKQEAPFKYYQNENFSAVKIPYVDSNYTMTIYLPNSSYSTNELTTSLTGDNWKIWNEGFEYKEVELSLPKFKFSFGTRLINQELIDLGLGIAFNPQLADFSNITDLQIYISRVLHKAFVEVNEEGTEAAAATIIEFEWTSIDPSKAYMVVNRPFVFTISEEQSESLLFMGRVAFPEFSE